MIIFNTARQVVLLLFTGTWMDVHTVFFGGQDIGLGVIGRGMAAWMLSAAGAIAFIRLVRFFGASTGGDGAIGGSFQNPLSAIFNLRK